MGQKNDGILIVVVLMVIVAIGAAVFFLSSPSTKMIPRSIATTTDGSSSVPSTASAEQQPASDVATVKETPRTHPEKEDSKTKDPKPVVETPDTSGTLVHGKVVDSLSGSPIADASVILHVMKKTKSWQSKVSRTLHAVTDNEGRYQFRMKSFGDSHLVTAKKEGYITLLNVDTDLREDWTEIDSLRMHFGPGQGMISGHVEDMNGKRLAGITITATGSSTMFGMGDKSLLEGAPSVVTDDMGEFQLQGLATESHMLTALKNNDFLSMQQASLSAVVPVIESLVFRVMTGGALSGRVVDEQDNPVAGISVTVGYRPIETDAQGRFQAKNIGPGPHAVRVAESERYMGARLSNIADETNDVVLQVQAKDYYQVRIASDASEMDWVENAEAVALSINKRNKKIRGWDNFAVADDDDPGLYHVYIGSNSGGGIFGMLQANMNGEKTESKPTKKLEFRAPGHYPQELDVSSLQQDKATNITLRAGALITGRVIDQTTSEPAPGVNVQLSKALAPFNPENFDFSEMFEAIGSGGGMDIATGSGGSGISFSAITMAVEGGSGDTGNGSTMSSVALTGNGAFTNFGFGGAKNSMTKTDADGHFSIRTIHEKNNLAFTHKDYADHDIKDLIVRGHTNLGSIPFDGGSQISGIAYDPDGRPASGAAITLKGNTEQEKPIYRTANADEQGAFTFEHIGIGEYVLKGSMVANNYYGWNMPELAKVAVQDSANIQQDIQLPYMVDLIGALDIPSFVAGTQYSAKLINTETMAEYPLFARASYSQAVAPGQYRIDITELKMQTRNTSEGGGMPSFSFNLGSGGGKVVHSVTFNVPRKRQFRRDLTWRP